MYHSMYSYQNPRPSKANRRSITPCILTRALALPKPTDDVSLDVFLPEPSLFQSRPTIYHSMYSYQNPRSSKADRRSITPCILTRTLALPKPTDDLSLHVFLPEPSLFQSRPTIYHSMYSYQNPRSSKADRRSITPCILTRALYSKADRRCITPCILTRALALLKPTDGLSLHVFITRTLALPKPTDDLSLHVFLPEPSLFQSKPTIYHSMHSYQNPRSSKADRRSITPCILTRALALPKPTDDLSLHVFLPEPSLSQSQPTMYHRAHALPTYTVGTLARVFLLFFSLSPSIFMLT